MRSSIWGALVCLLALSFGCGDQGEISETSKKVEVTTAAQQSPAKDVKPAPIKPAPVAQATPIRKPVAVAPPPPPPPAKPSGTPLVKGAPPFDHVSLGALRKKSRAKPLKYVSPAKRGVYWARTVHAATDEKGQRTYGKMQTKVFFTENAVGELAMVAEGRPDPNAQTRMAAMMKFVYQRTKKGKFKGDFQLVAKQGLMQKSPQPLRNAQLLVTSRVRKYKDAQDRYTITAKPVGTQDITVYGKKYKGALRMERSWTRRMGKEVIDVRENSWWAPGVGEVAKLARFGDKKGPDAVWTVTLLKSFGETDNPHTLTSHFKTMTAGQVNRHNVQAAMINQQLKNQTAKKAPQKQAPYLLGKDSGQAGAFLKRIFYLVPSGKPKVNKIKWGSLGVIDVSAQFYKCPPGKGCGYPGMLLFSNAKTGRVVGGLTNVSVQSGLKKLANTTQNFFKLIAGPKGADRVSGRVAATIRKSPKFDMVIGQGKLTIGQTSNRKSWTVAVAVP